jgi:hypothetical protein
MRHLAPAVPRERREGEGAKAASELFTLLILALECCAGFAGTKLENEKQVK